MVARFVTTEAINLKLGTHVPLGDHYSVTHIAQSDSPIWHKGALSEKTKNMITCLLIVRFLQYFYGGYT